MNANEMNAFVNNFAKSCGVGEREICSWISEIGELVHNRGMSVEEAIAHRMSVATHFANNAAQISRNLADDNGFTGAIYDGLREANA